MKYVVEGQTSRNFSTVNIFIVTFENDSLSTGIDFYSFSTPQPGIKSKDYEIKTKKKKKRNSLETISEFKTTPSPRNFYGKYNLLFLL